MSRYDNKYPRTSIKQTADIICTEERVEKRMKERFGAPEHPACPHCGDIMDNPLFQRMCQWCKRTVKEK